MKYIAIITTLFVTPAFAQTTLAPGESVTIQCEAQQSDCAAEYARGFGDGQNQVRDCIATQPIGECVDVVAPPPGPGPDPCTDCVTGFSLVDPVTDTIIGPLPDTLASGVNVAIVADVSGTVGQVSFDLSGPTPWNQVEEVPPYALFGDDGGDYDGQTLAPGDYTLTAGGLTVTFTVEGNGGDTGGGGTIPPPGDGGDTPDTIAYEDCGSGAFRNTVVYVDPENGSDSNPGTEAAPRQTMVLEANTTNLLKRGTVYRGPASGDTRIRPPHTADGVVFGAYGVGENPVIDQASHTAMKMQGIDDFTIRDLEVRGLDVMDGGNFNICYNYFPGSTQSVNLRLWRQTHHGLILENTFSGDSSHGVDALSIHDETHSGGNCFVKSAPSYDPDAKCWIGGHWWIIGNQFVGVTQEELIDIEGEGPEVEDIKLISNRFMGGADEEKCLKIYNNSRKVWAVGNDIESCSQQSMLMGEGPNTGYSEHYQVTGNTCDNSSTSRGCWRFHSMTGDLVIHSNTGSGQQYEWNGMPSGPHGGGDPMTIQPLGGNTGWAGPAIVGPMLEKHGVSMQ